MRRRKPVTRDAPPVEPLRLCARAGCTSFVRAWIGAGRKPSLCPTHTWSQTPVARTGGAK